MRFLARAPTLARLLTLVLTLLSTFVLAYLVPDALAAAPTADGWGDTAGDTAGALPGETLEVKARVDVSPTRWARAFIAMHECAREQGVYLAGDEDPTGNPGLNQLRHKACVRWKLTFGRAPDVRIADHRKNADQIANRLASMRRVGRAWNQLGKAQEHLARAWELEQLTLRAFGEPCGAPPEPLLVRFQYGPAGTQVKTFPVRPDTSFCN